MLTVIIYMFTIYENATLQVVET